LESVESAPVSLRPFSLCSDKMAQPGHEGYKFETDEERRALCKSELANNRIPPIPAHTGIFKLHMEAGATLNTTDVREAVKLPPGMKEEEWIASHVLGIYEEVVQTMTLLEEMCTDDTCPSMNAGKYVTYAWTDGKNGRPQKLAACDYMRRLAEDAYQKLADRTLIPIDGSPFPPEFRDEMKQLLKRLFRVYAHTYLQHFQIIRESGAEAHLNCCFKRFLFFVTEFNLVSRAEMSPLNDLIKKFVGEKAGKKEYYVPFEVASSEGGYKRVLQSTEGGYRVDNSLLKTHTSGLYICKSKSTADELPMAIANWGDILDGIEEEDEDGRKWLKFRLQAKKTKKHGKDEDQRSSVNADPNSCSGTKPPTIA